MLLTAFRGIAIPFGDWGCAQFLSLSLQRIRRECLHRLPLPRGSPLSVLLSRRLGSLSDGIAGVGLCRIQCTSAVGPTDHTELGLHRLPCAGLGLCLSPTSLPWCPPPPPSHHAPTWPSAHRCSSSRTPQCLSAGCGAAFRSRSIWVPEDLVPLLCPAPSTRVMTTAETL